MSTDRGGDDGEQELERSERQLQELLNEVRVAMPGVQVLFAFLLSVPFQAGFARIDRIERALYFAALLTSAIAAACLLAGPSIHRLLFHHHQRAFVIATTNRLVIVGLIALMLAMVAAITLVSRLIYGAGAGYATGAASATVIATLWFAIPLARRRLSPPPPPPR